MYLRTCKYFYGCVGVMEARPDNRRARSCPSKKSMRYRTHINNARRAPDRTAMKHPPPRSNRSIRRASGTDALPEEPREGEEEFLIADSTKRD
jgi:hypothetical protein